jgi:hypothetical protein
MDIALVSILVGIFSYVFFGGGFLGGKVNPHFPRPDMQSLSSYTVQTVAASLAARDTDSTHYWPFFM